MAHWERSTTLMDVYHANETYSLRYFYNFADNYFEHGKNQNPLSRLNNFLLLQMREAINDLKLYEVGVPSRSLEPFEAQVEGGMYKEFNRAELIEGFSIQVPRDSYIHCAECLVPVCERNQIFRVCEMYTTDHVIGGMNVEMNRRTTQREDFPNIGQNKKGVVDNWKDLNGAGFQHAYTIGYLMCNCCKNRLAKMIEIETLKGVKLFPKFTAERIIVGTEAITDLTENQEKGKAEGTFWPMKENNFGGDEFPSMTMTKYLQRENPEISIYSRQSTPDYTEVLEDTIEDFKRIILRKTMDDVEWFCEPMIDLSPILSLEEGSEIDPKEMIQKMEELFGKSKQTFWKGIFKDVDVKCHWICHCQDISKLEIEKSQRRSFLIRYYSWIKSNKAILDDDLIGKKTPTTRGAFRENLIKKINVKFNELKKELETDRSSRKIYTMRKVEMLSTLAFDLTGNKEWNGKIKEFQTLCYKFKRYNREDETLLQIDLEKYKGKMKIYTPRSRNETVYIGKRAQEAMREKAQLEREESEYKEICMKGPEIEIYEPERAPRNNLEEENTSIEDYEEAQSGGHSVQIQPKRKMGKRQKKKAKRMLQEDTKEELEVIVQEEEWTRL